MASLLRRLKLFTAGTTPARRFQACEHEYIYGGDNAELFEQAVALMEKKKFEQQKLFVHEQVTEQIKTQFEALLKVPVKAQSGPKISLSGFDREEPTHDPAQKGERDIVRELLGYSLKVEASSVPNAGEGVKIQGRLPIGSLVALFPGAVYLPEHFKKPQYLREVSNNVYARARFDSIIIDAKNETPSPRNPLAVAHKINHPPAGSSPNVMPFSYDFPPEEPFTDPDYQQFIPNSFVEMPSRISMFGKRALVHGLAFITTADIEDGEELFLNYRYNPDNELPEWYTSVDADSDRAMWK
ncbi:hypothetical protein Poli38472_000637 [Pythium oligandrum]|uniref:SET domain-containing protein n=1 Tax=Pythium oligandrum TaxID=41045 RepID=A0A8K1CCH4_PYTOL|nr:hypothetical protein Poli38472_000637 [Pythium oligandrum]|eukprot:TMW60595.1 hypothetical protein Poli38472_000637 [Pythium oligandrum]